MSRLWASLLAVVSLAGCDASDAPQRAEAPPSESFLAEEDDPLGGRGRSLARVTFGADGLTPTLSIPAFTGDALALWAKTEPGTCFAIASLEDAHGRKWVSEREAGPYCTQCAVRTSVAQGDGLFVLSRDESFVPNAGLSLRVGLVRCDTLTPLTTARGQSFELTWLPIEKIPERGLLSLRFVVSTHSMLFGRPDLQRGLVTQLNDELAETGLEVSLDEVVELSNLAPESQFSTADLSELAAVLDAAPAAPRFTVDIVFAGCLRYEASYFGPPTAVDGFTPRVGGGAGTASAIFMPGLRCDSFSADPATYPLATYAHTLVHELGHFLGLYHSIETDGTTDLLSDTDEANAMHYNPSLALARGFRPSQARHLRSHPWVRPLSSP